MRKSAAIQTPWPMLGRSRCTPKAVFRWGRPRRIRNGADDDHEPLSSAGGIKGLFSTHPATEERIARLRAMAAGADQSPERGGLPPLFSTKSGGKWRSLWQTGRAPGRLLSPLKLQT